MAGRPQGAPGDAAPNAAPNPAPNAAARAAPQGSKLTAVSVQDTRSLVISVGFEAKTQDPANAAARAESAAQAAGGYVSSASVGKGSQPTPSQPPDAGPQPVLPPVDAAPSSTQAVLVLRVPPAQLDAFLATLNSTGTVTDQTRSANDVTGQVADVNSRVGSAQAAIAELRTLLAKATGLNDVVSLETTLEQRQSDLESLEAQQRALSGQVQFATVLAEYYVPAAKAAAKPSKSGFGHSAGTGWRAFTTTIKAILTVLAWLLPFLATALIVGWPISRLIRSARRRAKTSPSE